MSSSLGKSLASSKCVHNSRRRSSRRVRLGIRARTTMSSIKAAIVFSSRMRVSKNGAHCAGDARPLFPLRFGAPPALGRQPVVLARAAGGTVSPDRLEQTVALHLVERRVHRALLQ